MNRWNHTLIIFGLSLACAATASARVDIHAEPSFGTYELETGFEADPTRYTVVAGGEERSRQFRGCDAGWIAGSPDLRVHYEAGSLPLRFYVDAEADTTLAINLPDGSWICNDDAAGLNPIVDLPRPESGQYDIFVGTADYDESPRVQVMVTELPAENGPGNGRASNHYRRPSHSQGSFGTVALEAGFEADPANFEITAGGTVEARSRIRTAAGQRCDAGFIASTPDLVVSYEAGRHPLRFFVDARGADTTLAIQLPNGTWLCNDDAVGLNPIIDLASPPSGDYQVYVGSIEADAFPEVTLNITELPRQHGPSGR